MPNKLTPVIIGSVIMIVISLLPGLNLLNLVCCAGILAGGFGGTYYYNNQLKKTGQLIRFKDGAAIGFLSGVFSAVIIVIFSTLLAMLVKQNPIPEFFKLIDSQGITIPPEMDRFMQKISDEYSKNGFSFTLTIITFVVDIITYPIFGALGGIIAAAIFTRRSKTNPE